MRWPKNQHFWGSILLLAVNILHTTTASTSGVSTPLPTDRPPLDVTHKAHFGNIHILRSNMILKKQKLSSGHSNSTKQTLSEVTPRGNTWAVDVLKDAKQSYGGGQHDTINNNYQYVVEKNTVSHTTARLPNAHESYEHVPSFLPMSNLQKSSETSQRNTVFKNARKHKVMRTDNGLGLKVRLTRSAQVENVPPNNEESNITITNHSTDMTTEVVTDLPKSEDNISTNIPRNTSISQEPAGINSIYDSEFSDEEITTALSNVIPRGPFIRNIPPAPPGPNPTKETEFQSNMKEHKTTFQVDHSQLKDTMTTQSFPVSEHNESITESLVHESDSHQKTLTKTMLPSEENVNFNADDEQPDAGDTVKLIRKLSQDHDNDKSPETQESSNDIFLEVSLSSSGDSMLVNWLFVSNNTHVSGFQVSYRMNNREDFDSSSLDISVRSFALHSLHEDEHYVICVHAMINNTAVKSSCAEWSRSSMKMVVGILAGTIFLVPCIVVMVLILYKDYKMTQKNRLQGVNNDTATGTKQLIPGKNTTRIHLQSYHDEVKDVEGDKADSKTCSTQASLAYSQKSLNKSPQDTGHENPCEHAADDSTDDDDLRGPWQRLSKQEAAMMSIPLHDELLSNSSATSISSKNNITYITVRRNSGASNDRNSHQNITHLENLSQFQDTIHL